MNRIPIQEGWKLNPETCPPDLHFIDYIRLIKPQFDMKIFHMGCGNHHTLGLWAVGETKHMVRAITISPDEVNEYIRLATEEPKIIKQYTVEFADIHLYNFEMLPRLDFFTYFHLGEISDHNDEAYGGWTISEIIQKSSMKIFSGGGMAFFSKSTAWEKIRDKVHAILRFRQGWKEYTYESLIIYRKPEADNVARPYHWNLHI